jgi:hypothetical protein
MKYNENFSFVMTIGLEFLGIALAAYGIIRRFQDQPFSVLGWSILGLAFIVCGAFFIEINQWVSRKLSDE